MAASIETRNKFQTSLWRLVNNNPSILSKPDTIEWYELFRHINQPALKDAVTKIPALRILFKNLGDMTARDAPKLITRVTHEIVNQIPERPNYFQPLSDFIALQVSCPLEEIQEKIDCISRVVLENKGHMYIQGPSKKSPYGSFMNSLKEYTDITQCVHVVLKNVGYPIEFQIGHEWATHLVKVDSLLRKNPLNDSIVDLWSCGFYKEVKRYILAKANGTTLPPKEEILTKAENIHLKGTPVDLQKILGKL